MFRSVAHIYVQAVDDAAGTTLVSASTVEPALKAKMGAKVRGGNIAGAELIGQAIAERLIEKGIKQACLRPQRLPVSRARQGGRRGGARKPGLEF